MTHQQREIIQLLAAGGTNKELAERLGLREQTVKNQLSRIYTKLGLRNRVELVIFAAVHRLGPDS